MNRISKIVITGGPCAGKSTAMSWIRNAFSHRGYTVLIVPETATELITGGVAPWTCQTNADYQKCQVELQLTKERLFEQAASGMASEKILIVCDRGVMDNRAYMNEEEFEDVLRAEFGFDGVVMTDWLIAQMKDKRAAHSVADPAKIPASGNDLVMPGTKADCQRVLNALRSGALDRDQARRNVSRLIRLARELNA